MCTLTGQEYIFECMYLFKCTNSSNIVNCRQAVGQHSSAQRNITGEKGPSSEPWTRDLCSFTKFQPHKPRNRPHSSSPIVPYVCCRLNRLKLVHAFEAGKCDICPFAGFQSYEPRNRWQWLVMWDEEACPIPCLTWLKLHEDCIGHRLRLGWRSLSFCRFSLSCVVLTVYKQLLQAHKHYYTYTTDRGNYSIHLSSRAHSIC